MAPQILDFADGAARPFMEMSPYPMFVLGAQGTILAVNSASCRHFGAEPEQWIGRDAIAMQPLKDRAAHRKHLNAWLSGETYPTRLRWKGREGVETFLVFATLIAFGDRSAVLASLLPAPVVSAALAGRIAKSAMEAREWVRALAERADASRSASRDLERGADPELAKLTPREWEITRRIAEGDRVKLVAEDLRISPNTVRNHLKSIFRKLGVASQAQLVRRVRALVRGR